MPNVLIAGLEEIQDGGNKKISILQPEVSPFVFNILSNYFGGSSESGYVAGARWLKEVPQEVMAVIKKLYRVDHGIGIVLYERNEDERGDTREDHGGDCDHRREDFPITECAMAVNFRGKNYLLAQWRSDERTPTPIYEMKKVVQEKFERAMQRLQREYIYLEKFDQAPFMFAP